MLNDYKYAIRAVKQAGNYNKITTYLILHIRKTYEHGRDIANAIESQGPFNFKPSALKLQILLIVKTENTTPQEKLEIKHQNDQYRIEYKAELQLYLKQKSHSHMNLGKAYAFLFGQCTTGLQHRIEAKAKYESKIKGNTIRLLEVIKQNSLSFDDKKYTANEISPKTVFFTLIKNYSGQLNKKFGFHFLFRFCIPCHLMTRRTLQMRLALKESFSP